jgi:hypothetical protein
MSAVDLNPLYVSKLREWRDNPVQFVEECIGAKPSEQQKELLMSLVNPKRKKYTARSGHGCGKDAFASWAILWFMVTRPFPKIVCVAPTKHQLRDILWAEIHKWLRQSKVKDEFKWNSERIHHINHKEEWFAVALSVNAKASPEEQAETLAGHHATHQLIVVDEASGVPDPVYLPLEGALTSQDNKVILIGNMTKNTGYFFDTHFHPEFKNAWEKFHWSSEDSTNVATDYVDYMKTKYGVDSNVYRIRVLGEPPLEGTDGQVVIPFHWANQCIGNEVHIPEDALKIIGVDVAGRGGDKSVVMPRRGMEILPYHEYDKVNHCDLGEFIKVTASLEKASGIGIDENGIGFGVTDWLIRYYEKINPKMVKGVNVTRESFKVSPVTGKKLFYQLRDDLWWKMRERCMNSQYSFPDNEQGRTLVNELSLPHYDINPSTGVIKVESKKSFRGRAMRDGRKILSPDHAEALLMTEVFFTDDGEPYSTVKQKVFEDKIPYYNTYADPQAWMAV